MLSFVVYPFHLLMMELTEFQHERKDLLLHKASAKVCDNVPAVAIDALFHQAPDSVCNTCKENAVNVEVEISVPIKVGILIFRSFRVPPRNLYFI